MSHFTVMIIGEDPETMLAPYDEAAEGVFHDCTDEVKAMWEENKSSKILDGKTVQETYETIEKFADQYFGYVAEPDIDGEQSFGHYANDEGHWDWYSLGGRWQGFFIHKPLKKCKYPEDIKLGECGVGGEEKMHERACDQLRKCDIDIEAMRAEAGKHAAKYWKEHHEGPTSPWMDEDVVKMTEAEYCEKRMRGIFETFALIDENGWRESGRMGWWGMVMDPKDPADWKAEFDARWNEIPDDTLISVYDCHV